MSNKVILSKKLGRAKNGGFLPGNTEGQGNPFNRQVQALRAAMISGVSAGDIAEVIATLVTAAKSGDISATKLLLSYCIGQPHQTPVADTSDLDNLQAGNKKTIQKKVHDWDVVCAVR